MQKKVIIENFWNFDINQYGRQIISQNDFYEMLITAAGGVRDFVYLPKSITPINKNDYKITHTTFSDCSFSITTIENIEFYGCKFINCKFLKTKFINCKFHDCKFELTNMSFAEVSKTYIDPDFFRNIIPNYTYFSLSVNSANMCTTFFQTLYHNAKDSGQEEHKKNADYHFKKWKGLNLIQKRFTEQPFTDKISWKEFLTNFPPNLFQYVVTGYGYRISNYLFTFLLIFFLFFYSNHKNWASFALEKRDVTLNNFNPDSSSLETTFYYTLDATTKLVDSQIQPRSYEGMMWLSFQGVVGFVLLSLLITIIINKFVK
jgi:uncharacterized protein YjbI with pentapeptide repeats